MKHRLLAAITIATTAIPCCRGGRTPASAVSCTSRTCCSARYPSYTRVALYQNATNPAAAVQCLEQRLNELGYIGTPAAPTTPVLGRRACSSSAGCTPTA